MNHEMNAPVVSCKLNGSLPAGGVVFQLAADDRGQYWAGTSAGIFVKGEGGWKPVLRGFPYRDAPVIAVTQKIILAASSAGGLVRSADRGRSWHRSLLPPQVGTITCLAMSPRFLQDGVALAGTEGQGILRSVDGGRSWAPANFGLRNFQAVAVQMAPSWQRKEPVFAAMEQGVYYSPNGGRAWQQTGLDAASILSLAVSPHYWDDGVVAAGSADGRIFCSHDRGKSWSDCSPVSDSQDPTNQLLFSHSGLLLAGMGSGAVLASNDCGLTWERLATLPDSVLSLEIFDQAFFAGAGISGLFVSMDQGKSWQLDESLKARRVHVLAVRDDASLAAGGIAEGIWLTQDGGESWLELSAPEGELPDCLSLAWQDENLLAACGRGLLSFTRPVMQGSAEPLISSAITLKTSQQAAWAGCMDGSIWYRSSGESQWQKVKSPCSGMVINIDSEPGDGGLGSLLAANRNDSTGKLEFWRSSDGGETWQLLGTEAAAAMAVRSACLGGRWYMAVGSRLVFNSPQGWQRVTISGEDAPVAALLALPDIGLLVATPDRLLFSSDGFEWIKLQCEMAEYGIADLRLVSSDIQQARAAGLTSDGKYFTLEILQTQADSR